MNDSPYKSRLRMLCRGLRLLVSFAAAILITHTTPVWGTPVFTNPYLGIVHATDSIVLTAPSDQTPGSGLGTHTAQNQCDHHRFEGTRNRIQIVTG